MVEYTAELTKEDIQDFLDGDLDHNINIMILRMELDKKNGNLKVFFIKVLK